MFDMAVLIVTGIALALWLALLFGKKEGE